MPLVTRTSNQGNFFKEEEEPTNWLEGDLWSKISTGVLSMNVGGEAVPVSLIP